MDSDFAPIKSLYSCKNIHSEESPAWVLIHLPKNAHMNRNLQTRKATNQVWFLPNIKLEFVLKWFAKAMQQHFFFQVKNLIFYISSKNWVYIKDVKSTPPEPRVSASLSN